MTLIDIGHNFLLMHDNVSPHATHAVQNYLQDVSIQTLVWPANIPDLNSIEHLWDNMGRRLIINPYPTPFMA